MNDFGTPPRFLQALLRLVPVPLRRSVAPWWFLARLDRPIGWVLLLVPGWWALALSGAATLRLYLLFWVGAILMRAAGCVVNDLTDRVLDQQVARTAERPLASGAIAPRSAVVFLALLLAASAAILFSLPQEAILLGIASLPLIFAYPRMKRITWWPQVFLGLVFSWGALLGFVAAGVPLGASAFYLYCGCVFWTLGYDTIYAAADLQDDLAVGIRSTAVRLKGRIRHLVAGCFFFATVFWGVALFVAEVAWLGFVGWVLVAYGLVRQVAQLPQDAPPDPDVALVAFRFHGKLGLVFFVFLVLADFLL